MSAWQPIETAPTDGTRVRVKHELAPESKLFPTTGAFQSGRWICSAGFVDPETGRLYFEPTHWRPS